MLINKSTFYSSYLHDYFGYKLFLYSNTLFAIGKFENDSGIHKKRGYKRKQLEVVLKSEIRQTYFQSIEALFEIIFALKPEGKKLFDDEIHMRLANSNWRKNYKSIEKIATDINELNFFDEFINISNIGDVSIGKHLFFFGVNPKSTKLPKEFINSIPGSIENIKKGLQIFAKDFTKRDEYNSYKHGVRIIPAFKSLTLVDADNMKSLENFDLSDSMTYIVTNDKGLKTTYKTRIFETKRDFELCKLATMLISNIISLRKASLKLGDKEVAIYSFPFDNFDDIEKSNLKIQNLSYTIQKVK